MLDQTNYWVNIAGTAVDALLLGRVLQLRLQRVYLFITLACVLVLLFDGIDIWLWSEADTRLRVFLYSRFVFAVAYPLAGWDVFEEMNRQVLKMRKIAAAKLISGLIFAMIFGFIVTAFVVPGDTSGQPAMLATLGLVAWAGSAAATLGFLWTLRRVLRAQKIPRPNNTSVWMTFWMLVLLAELVSCFCSLALPFFKSAAADIVTLILLLYGIAITSWCILKLRAVPSDVSSPASENL